MFSTLLQGTNETPTVDNWSAKTLGKQLTLRDLGVAYSLATLFFIIPWKELLYPGTNGYLLAVPAPVFEHWAIFTNVLILTVVFLLLFWVSSASLPSWLQRAGMLMFCGAALLAFAPLSSEFLKWYSPETKHLIGAPLPVAVMITSLIACSTSELTLSRFTKNIKIIALFFLPFCLVIFLKSFQEQLVREDPALSPASIESADLKGDSKLNNRVVWIILDELDYAALDISHKIGLKTDEFDRLMNRSFVAHNAHAPSDNTMVSIPALLTGRPIRRATAISSKDLSLREEDNRSFSLLGTSNLFRELKSIGGRAAIVGWYHPYSRVFQDDVDFCYWRPMVNRECSELSGFRDCSLGIWSRSLSVIPFGSMLVRSPHRVGGVDVRAEEMSEQVSRSEYLESKSLDLVSDPNLNLVFLHLSVPHFPYLAPAGEESRSSYFTAVEVANDTLRRVREALEKSGQWDSTTLIVSSDHPWREKLTSQEAVALVPPESLQAFKEDERIPFIVKLAGDDEHVDHEPRVNTLVTKQLILDILVNKVRSASDLELWFQNVSGETARK